MKFPALLICTWLVGQSTLLAQSSFPTLGKVVRIDPQLDALIASDAKIEVLASGFVWAEGPVWIKEGGYLLFSDVPQNTVFKWSAKDGLTPFLKPSGFTGASTYGDEPGSNGLTLNRQGHLVLAEHGDRRISVMPLTGVGKRTIVDNYQGKRFNSPNDVVQHSGGAYYFTDPPYGLPKKHEDPTREIDWFGVYRAAADGKVTLLTKDMTRPNGLAFSPDEKILYVAQSDPGKAVIMAFPMLSDGTVGPGKVFYDATPMVKQGLPGLPDGLKVDANGNVWSTGPGGVLILSPSGKLLGRIDTGEATANCGWGDDGSTLYITADMYLCRIRTKTKGAGW
ncbi:SMP-30/gluconolactonase/LRE family protein [Runella salmonicolor]|uniref:SMP-30/gluconolactonase/LRE family protein n=1 Tax=Runella salmonicolor TaxID=2950278 RepID=A0ABT1FVW4_9BACT|nr:SMP-30/gluconolactonase/LRE family protein [Runella salmonicolor]MCP1385610.1 SMP-30/gluconolactonase/LRE family protein [Runella salmonicolor]